MLKRLIVLLSLALGLPVAAQAEACGMDTACPLGERSYHLRVPDDWDGTSPLPVLLHFHGWARQGDLVVRHQRIAGHTRRRGVLLVAPNGRQKTWDFRRANSADVPFAAAVLEDVAKNYPIDRSRLYVSGYSYGAAMAWRYTCQNGDGVTALLAISGTLREGADCPQAPAQVRQVYGFDDTVMRLDFGPGRNETRPVDMWLKLFGCGAGDAKGPYKVVDWLTFERRQWTDCDTGQTVTLDLHPGGHFIPHGWIGRQLDELLGRTPTYP